ncbi:PREDICTED: carbohydrate sulfotransferase 10-like [Branchiostoma belcheri]|uniref:Carbohydrate sulfotransferase n=1 Tax=Branchiostoma belcheri TaxID=7741 RepID=A0A6P4Z271_BRABE|nr:PREDICTED: carbohydrate sulfotransferase 10-like [Branchiostoma belcheri]
MLGTLDKRQSVEITQFERKALLRKYCREHFDKKTVFPPKSRFVVSEKYKLLYCQVFKTGSTTTLTILHNLEHGEERSTKEMRDKLDTLPFKRLNDYTNKEVRNILETYTKLLITRNPLERLASAWRHKFVDVPLRFWFRKEYHSMLETISLNTSIPKPHINTSNKKDIGNETYPIVPFLAFIKAVGTNRTDWQNPHWEQISDLCAPCQIAYDFIAHTETLAEDFPLFFKTARITGKDNLLPDVRQRKSEKLFSDFYRPVSIEDLRRVKEKFKKDYDMFGYSFNDDIKGMF